MVIGQSYDDESARQLAIRLLDKGSADQVLIGENWNEDLAEWLGESTKLNQSTQLLVMIPDSANDAAVSALTDFPGSWAVVNVTNFFALTHAIDFAGSRTLDKFPEMLKVYKQQGEVRISGGPEREVDDKTGIEWVRICPGTFNMSSERVAVLSGFWIAATETTNQQYAAINSQRAVDDRPKASINWDDARQFCRDVDADGNLPTEAQWEYAARSGSQTTWSFGDDEAQLKNYAWYDDNADEAQPVKQKLANPLGLYDVHGNVWEWVQDWYEPRYEPGVFVDPLGPSVTTNCPWGDECRVLRGGSFANSPE